MATATNDPFAAAISTIKERIPQNLSSPTVGIVCGSGLKGLADSLTQRHEISYDDLKGFGKSTGTPFHIATHPGLSAFLT
jgi:purine nucleoside phosphorylase